MQFLSIRGAHPTSGPKRVVGSVRSENVDASHLERRGLRRHARVWHLWALGVGAVISGEFYATLTALAFLVLFFNSAIAPGAVVIGKSAALLNDGFTTLFGGPGPEEAFARVREAGKET